MEEKESILNVVLVAITLLIMPGPLNKDAPLYAISLLAILVATVVLATAMILLAVKNIPNFAPYLPVGLGDNVVKILAWTGVFIVGILIIIINVLESLAA
ncbi:MAG: hypothetical protein ACW98F_12725 [Candidatus Hodarchaeales archaeon]|jgi:hypothetical protein